VQGYFHARPMASADLQVKFFSVHEEAHPTRVNALQIC